MATDSDFNPHPTDSDFNPHPANLIALAGVFFYFSPFKPDSQGPWSHWGDLAVAGFIIERTCQAPVVEISPCVPPVFPGREKYAIRIPMMKKTNPRPGRTHDCAFNPGSRRHSSGFSGM